MDYQLPTKEQADALLQGGHISPDLYQRITGQSQPDPIAPQMSAEDSLVQEAKNAPVRPEYEALLKQAQKDLPSGGGFTSPEQLAQSRLNQLDAFNANPGAFSTFDAAKMRDYQNQIQGQQVQKPDATPNAVEVSANAPTQPSIPSVSPNQSTDGKAVVNPMPTGMQDNPMAQMQGSILGGINKALDQQQQGINEKARAEGALGLKQGQALDSLTQRLQQMDEQAKARAEEARAKLDTMHTDIMNTKVDPNRYWNNLDTGSKITGSIALALGGMAQGFSGGKVGNAALDIIQKNIDRDIDAQKVELGKKQSAYSHFMEQYRDERAADLAARSNAISVVQNQVAALTAKAQNPVTLANAKILNGQLEQQRAQVNADFGMRLYQLQQKSMVQNGVQGVNLEALNKEDRERAASLPGGAYGLTKDVETRRKVDDFTAKDSAFRKDLADLIDFAKKHTGTNLDRATVNKGKSMAAALQNSYRNLEDMGVYKESEAEFMKRIVGDDPTTIFSYIPQLQALQTVAANKRDAFYSANVQNYRPVSFKPAK